MGGPGRGGRADRSRRTLQSIMQAKCGCHGPGGSGGRAPSLTGLADRSDADLTKIIHDGKGKMPAFGGQLSDAQIKTVVAH